ncbi:site-specific DNA-methyltransferase [bacterium]|nr:site-specific DNA-methyltransferase [candidate division CSSED10-310 bacterium]
MIDREQKFNRFAECLKKIVCPDKTFTHLPLEHALDPTLWMDHLKPLLLEKCETVYAELNDNISAKLNIIFKQIAEFFGRFYENGRPIYRYIVRKEKKSDCCLSEQLSPSSEDNYFLVSQGKELNLYPNLKQCLTRMLENLIKDRLFSKLPSGSKNSSDEMEICKGIRDIAAEIINWLADSETKLVNTFTDIKHSKSVDYCMTLNRIPPELLNHVLECNPLWEKWRNQAPETFDMPLFNDIDIRKQLVMSHPHWVVETSCFERSFITILENELANRKQSIDGLLIKSDNFHALRYLQRYFNDRIQCIYIDPPFNTFNRNFAYKDSFSPFGWKMMMNNRFKLARNLLTGTGSIYVHIDTNQKLELLELMHKNFHVINEIIWRIGWVSGFKGKANKYIRNHDTIIYAGKSSSPYFKKHYIPYPEGYQRRKGSSPQKGYPIEDTWNCSSADVLHSIQLMSFSKEKVAAGLMTQKNENLLERILKSSTKAGEWVMDYFAGTGTTCAAAHKMGRRWIGIDQGDMFDTYLLRRMINVISGDPYGISSTYRWEGGGLFKIIHLESFEECIDFQRSP